MLKPRYQELALYNSWANRRIYEAAAALADADYRDDHAAFFKSVHGTLNHLVVTDGLWMARFRQEPPLPYGLDHILFEDFAELRAAREAKDAEIEAFVEGQSEALLQKTFTYRTVTNPATVTQPLAPALDHFFNHQTHHRGQTHALLTRIAGSAPSLDLIGFQREAGLGGVTIAR